MTESWRGRLLVASPELLDPNFFRTVVLLLEHGPDGAVGVVLNRPGDHPLAELLPFWAPVAAEPAVLYAGGPVATESAIGLALASPAPSLDAGAGDDADGFLRLGGGLGTVDLERDPDTVRPTVERLRVFAGYAGWGPLQLEREIEEGSWFVLDAEPDDAWSRHPGGLWRTVLARQRGPLAMLASFPLDPSSN